ncbi:MAG: DUF362 domain-containing protein [Spirochaetaceae bacterium]|jgi:uncharacterized protein (DUF362 family)|nr:DUF362 domain-containing protein [Spirochaetaceae bacterium]
MLENEILNWFGTDPFEAGYTLIQKSQQWEHWKKEELIGLKPNLVVSKKASSGATTHPEFVSGVISFLQEKGFNNLKIVEGSWVGDSTERAFKVCGYSDISKKYNVPLVDLQKDDSVLYKASNGEYRICNSVMELDRLINMPVLKGHCQTSVTCALKNLKGCIPDSEKRRYHREGLHQPIADLNEILRPDLILVDGLQGDPDFEEGGNPCRMNLFLGAVDPVLADSYVTGLLGLTIDDVPYIGKAADLGVGSIFSDKSVITYLNKGEGLEGIERTGLANRLGSYISEKGACSSCYALLMQALVVLEKNGNLPAEPVLIGQGYKDQTVKGQGIGICLNGSSTYVKGCPPTTEDILKFLS